MNPTHDDLGRFELIESVGPGPFITRRTYRHPDGSHLVWHSRAHRKRLPIAGQRRPMAEVDRLLRCLWMPRQLNWWIAVVFAAGSSLFILGSVLSLAPALARAWGFDATATNAVYFAGSIPFTTAAYLQLYQTANAGEFSPHGLPQTRHTALFGWRPHDIGWLSCALQFPGTILFNFNTFDAMLPALDWLQQDLVVWVPDVVGSILFLASGYLAFIEICHAYFAWRPGSISWWVTFSNLLGCVAFMISAVFAFVPRHSPSFDAIELAIAFTLTGGVGFLAGSLLMLPETASSEEERPLGNGVQLS